MCALSLRSVCSAARRQLGWASALWEVSAPAPRKPAEGLGMQHAHVPAAAAVGPPAAVWD